MVGNLRENGNKRWKSISSNDGNNQQKQLQRNKINVHRNFYFTFYSKKKNKQGNQKDIRKIYLARQFLEVICSQRYFFENKKMFLDIVQRSVFTKFQIYIFFRWAGAVRQNHTLIHIYMTKHNNINANCIMWILKTN